MAAFRPRHPKFSAGCLRRHHAGFDHHHEGRAGLAHRAGHHGGPDPLFDAAEDNEALVSFDNPVYNPKFGISYTSSGY